MSTASNRASTTDRNPDHRVILVVAGVGWILVTAVAVLLATYYPG